jgi:hypothetical protein
VTLFETFRDFARKDLDRLAEGLDYGLIHADLVRENVLVDGQELRMIDFDDGGWGFRMFDVATALFKNRHESGYDTLKTALLCGLSFPPHARHDGTGSVRGLAGGQLCRLDRAPDRRGWFRRSEPAIYRGRKGPLFRLSSANSPCLTRWRREHDKDDTGGWYL